MRSKPRRYASGSRGAVADTVCGLPSLARRGSPSVRPLYLLTMSSACVAADLDAVAIGRLTAEHVVVPGLNEDMLAHRVAAVGALQGSGVGLGHHVSDTLGP